MNILSQRHVDQLDCELCDLTIVINTCDTYNDVLKIFFYAFDEYWADCPYPIVINTNSNADLPCAGPIRYHQTISTVDDWGARLRSTLGTVKTTFVLMVYDDFILNSHVSNSCIKKALELLKMQADAAVTYLTNTSLPLAGEDHSALFIPVKERASYRLNSAPGIWRRNVLLKYTAIGDTPWAWEAFGTYRSFHDGSVVYTLNPQKPDIYPYNHTKGGAIYRGRWVKDVVREVAQKYPLEIDWDKRGFASDLAPEGRSLLWKLRFLQTGFRMVGFRVSYFVWDYIKGKIRAL